MDIRIGFGFDVHAFQTDRDLWLGGVRIPHHSGLKGHSDADVLLHACCDAMLGALALGDIGSHFPDTDPKYKDIDSKILLVHTYRLITEKGYTLGNMDATISAEYPKMKPHIPDIRQCISQLLHVDYSCISVKATTTEKLGFEGREEGISCSCVVLLRNEA